MSYPLYIKALISYIEAHITEKRLDYARLEREIGFSQAHMRELFRRDTGYPLVQYVQMRKIKRSALDLLTDELE
ncbi:MAG: hypothetical protein IJY09_04035 [Lachnospiraceae bacterium]|nr:hypothetical protein [Lachnospiraceae bacterium]